MYYESILFTRKMITQKAFWKDGELWTAIIGGLLSYIWLTIDPIAMVKIRQHFSDLIAIVSIIFGFALAAVVFYIEAAGAWANNVRVQKVANKLVDWHVWTLLCLLFLIAYILGLWALGGYLPSSTKGVVLLYAFLCYQILYIGFQLLNHALTVWWAFYSRNTLRNKKNPVS